MSSAPRVIVRPLGGCGEVGLNATLFEDGDDLLLVDCGVGLGLDPQPGVERWVPELSALSRPGKRLLGVILTHGHEDHVGAIPELFLEQDVPVYGPPLAILFARSRLERRGMPHDHLISVPIGGRLTLGPFTIEWIRVTHSIPDSAALCLETRAGVILHSGDFKLDPRPIDGRGTDVARLAELGERGVDLLLSDSTNAEVPGRTASESEVGVALERVARECEGRLVVACFASHLHRLESLGRAAAASGRSLVFVGGALHRAYRHGLQAGHLHVEAELAEDLSRLAKRPKRDALLAVTGAQGEGRAALARIALDRALPLGPGDRVVLSSSTIPGNERSVRRVVNALALQGCEVIDDGLEPVHCSGHAHQDEQAELVRLLKPRCFVPIHGDRAMLEAHARTARAAGAPRTIVIEDGESVALEGGEVHRGDAIEARARSLDGADRLLSGEAIEARHKLASGGLVSCALALGDGGLLAPPAVSLVGLPHSALLPGRLSELVSAEVEGGRRELVERVRTALKREVKRALGSRPVVHVQLLELGVGRDHTSFEQPSPATAENGKGRGV